MPLSVREFSDKVRSRKPEYAHLDDADLIQMVTQKKPELLGSIDRDDLIKVSNESVSKQISKERQKQFGALSGYSRFMSGAGAGMLDTYNGIKQLFGGDVEGYKGDKAAYMDASKGSKTAAAGEVVGGIAATLPTMLIPGGAAAGLASKVASPLAKTAIKLGASKAAGAAIANTAIGLGAAGAAGAGYGATEFVDEGETRAKNALIGGLFGAGSAGAGMLIKKVGTKAFNALKGQYADANVQELMDLSKKYDIPLSKGDVTGKGRSTEKALEGVPLVGMGGFRKEGGEKVQSAIQKKSGEVMPDWDKALQESLVNQAKAGKAQAKINYGKVEDLMGGAKITPDKSIKRLGEIEKEFKGDIPEDIKTVDWFRQVRANMEAGKKSYSSLRQTREGLGREAAKYEAKDPNRARLINSLKADVENDMESAIVEQARSMSKRKGRAFVKGIEKETFFEPAEGAAKPKGVLTTDDERALSGVMSAEAKKQMKKGGELISAYNQARRHYRNEVVPYMDRKIVNAMKSETPDELFDSFIKKGKGDRAQNFFELLDDKGKTAFKSGLVDNAITGATTEATGQVSPAKLAGYLERMSDPIESTLKGRDLDDIKGFAKIMRHAERYGQLNENPSNGMSLIPYLKAGALAAAGYGGATNPAGTAAAALGAGVLTKLTSLMKTKGYKVALASDKIGSPAFEKAVNEIIKQLPRVSVETAKELKD